jgi:hypothetical protein
MSSSPNRLFSPDDRPSEVMKTAPIYVFVRFQGFQIRVSGAMVGWLTPLLTFFRRAIKASCRATVVKVFARVLLRGPIQVAREEKN